jgi:HSP90 family molecular chaperone
MVKIGSCWTSSDRRLFTVTDVKTHDTGTFIYYMLQGTDKHYNCLIGAFLSRFSIQET